MSNMLYMLVWLTKKRLFYPQSMDIGEFMEIFEKNYPGEKKDIALNRVLQVLPRYMPEIFGKTVDYFEFEDSSDEI